MPALSSQIPRNAWGLMFSATFDQQPSRSSRLRIALRNRRTASAFSRSRRSDGFSYERRRFISRKAPSRCIFFFKTRSGASLSEVAAPKPWQRTRARARPSSTIAPAMRSRSMRSSGSIYKNRVEMANTDNADAHDRLIDILTEALQRLALKGLRNKTWSPQLRIF
jgi:hypothetical protein